MAHRQTNNYFVVKFVVHGYRRPKNLWSLGCFTELPCVKVILWLTNPAAESKSMGHKSNYSKKCLFLWATALISLWFNCGIWLRAAGVPQMHLWLNVWPTVFMDIFFDIFVAICEAHRWISVAHRYCYSISFYVGN